MDAPTPTLGQLLIASGVMNPVQVIECLEIQERGRHGGPVAARMGAIAVERGYLKGSELEELLQHQSRLAQGQGPPVEGRSRPSDLVQEFRILRELGRDSTSRVCFARHTATGALVSVRLFNPDSHSQGSPDADPILAKVRTALELRHHSIPPPVVGGRRGNELFFAAGFVEGTSLRRILEEAGPLPWRWCWEIGVALVSALRYLHGQGSLHLQIRPSNVLIARDGRALLSGIGSAASPLTDVEWLLETRGTVPVYLAPEQREPEGPADARSDLYSLGATLYHAVTGSPPFMVRSRRELPGSGSMLALTDAADLNPDLPPAFARLLGRLLAVRPSNRFDSAQEVENELARLRPRSDPETGQDGRLADRRRRVDACLSGWAVPPEGTSRLPLRTYPRLRKGFGPSRLRVLHANVLPVAIGLALIVFISVLYRSFFAYRIFMTRGEELYIRGDRRGALKKFLKSQVLRPDVPAVQERILSLALETRNFPLATGQLGVLRRLMPGRGKELDLLSVDLAMWGNRFQEALEGYRRIREARGDDLEIRLRIAHAEAACRDLEGALASFREIHQDFPSEPRALLELARLSAALGHPEDSMQFYASTLRAGMDSAPVLEEYAHTLEACHAFSAAAQVYGRLSAGADKGGPMMILARARCLYWDGDFEQARRTLAPLGGMESAPPDGRALLAHIDESLEERELAETVWKDLVSRHPDRLDYSLELARFYERWGKRDRAIAHLGTTLRSFGAVPEVTSFLGRLHAARGESGEAIDFYRQAVRALPSGVDERIELAHLLVGAQRLSDAVEVVEDVPESIQKAPRIDLERARIYSRQGRKKEASELVALLEPRVGTDRSMARALSEVDLETSETGRAKLFEKYLAQHPEDLEAMRRFAELLRAGGDHSRAWPLYRKMSEAEPPVSNRLVDASEEACWAGDPEAGLRLLDGLRAAVKSANPKVRETAPPPELLLRHIISAAFQAGLYARAEESLVELRGLGTPFSVEDWLLRSKALELSGRTLEALDLLAPLLVSYPRHVTLHAEVAQLSVQLQRFDQAARIFGRLAELEPGVSQWPVKRIQVLFWSGEVAAAQAALHDLSVKHPQWRTREVMTVEAELDLRKQNFARAAPLLEELRSSGPPDEALERNWIRAKALAGDPSGVQSALASLRAARPEDPAVLVLAGDVAFSEHRFDEAARSYKEAMVLGDFSRDTRLRMARVWGRTGRVAEAVESYEALFRESPRDPVPLRDKARLLGWKGEPRASLREYDRLISCFPESIPFRLERDAKAALYAGNHAAAKTAYEGLLRADPGNSQALYDLAEMFRQDNQWEEARKAYQAVQEAEPANKEPREDLRRLDDTRNALGSLLTSSYLEEESSERKTDVRRFSYGIGFDHWLSDHFKARGSVESEDYRFRDGPSVQAYRAMGYLEYSDRPGWAAVLGVGVRQYSMSISSEPLLDARVGYRPEGGLGVEAFVTRDAYTRNVGTMFEGLYLTQEGIQLNYRPLPGLDVSAQGAYGTLTDGNQYMGLEGRIQYSLVEGESPIYAVYRLRRDGFHRDEDLYFAPHNLIQQGVGLSWRVSLGGGDPRPRYFEPGYQVVFDSNGQTGHLFFLGFRYPLAQAIQVGADVNTTVGNVYEDKHGSIFLSLLF
jgi:tetratricopeptide (TPR) repeat protein